MCGIVGYTGNKEALPVLMRGLEYLEYRGYDSAGVACARPSGRGFSLAREKGKLSVLRKKLKGSPETGSSGIGHTRWATHGVPSRRNAHPHTDASGRVAVVHNGIIENHAELRRELERKGVRFRSDTDTEVAAALIGSFYRKDLPRAFLQALKKLEGFFCLVVFSWEKPEELLVFRRANPVCVGLGSGENYIASDVTPLLPYTRRVLYLEDDEMARVTPSGVRIVNTRTGKQIRRVPVMIRWDISQAQKAGYPHFMLKEIHEQPRILAEILAKRFGPRGRVVFDSLIPAAVKRIRAAKRILTVSCGTAYHAGLAGSLLFEQLARIPSMAQVSSEFRYSDPILGRQDLVVLITQSGETADTLAALREARSKGAFTLAVVNVVGSTIAREADAVIYTHAGPEIGVASTKAYTAQLMTLTLFAFYLAGLRKARPAARLRSWLREARTLPSLSRRVLKLAPQIDRAARRFYRGRNFLYLGRGYNYPTALEGALKLKEISYAHAHGYAAGEMKHGPIALIDSTQPVICLAPHSNVQDKMASNMQEIKARGGILMTVATEGDRELEKISDIYWGIPLCSSLFTPVLAVIPLQLFAYRIAVLNKRDVDQPRNLAKSVTVE